MFLVTGATGYIGGRLVRRLEAEGAPVRCLCRRPEALRGRIQSTTELQQGDLLEAASLAGAFRDVDAAYYLVHSMNSGPEFADKEVRAALNFAAAARDGGVRRIIYLGGLAHGGELSNHMRSRLRTGQALRSSGIPVIEFRASIVIGSGSASFEVIRALVERLPLMITPRWVRTAAQPIAIEDVIEYLIAALRIPLRGSAIYEIGGRDVTSYAGIMREFARQRGLRRWIVPVPFLTPSLSSRWLTLITPVYAGVGRCLIESVRNPSVVRDPVALRDFDVRPMGVAEALERALANEKRQAAETRWCDAGFRGAAAEAPLRRVLTYRREMRVPLPPEKVFAPIRRIGGQAGWYFANTLWRIRGLIDLLLGGVGMRRGRPDPENPLPGSTLDFWRVEAYEPGRRLRLSAEMRLPGRAWLEFDVEPAGACTVLRQIATFEPRGLVGLLYWRLLYPVHSVMFRGMLRRLAEAALKAG
jgi:uncharacterized protein YbjT (DUF2867 family)